MTGENRYPIDDFLDEVKSHREDRGYLARLKHGLAEGTEDQAWGILAMQGFDFSNAAKRKVWATVGGLAAILVDDGLLKTDGWDNMGVVMRRIMNSVKSVDESRRKTYEMKLRRLLNCTSAVELCELVAEAVRQAAAKGISVNCRQLYFDLNGWDDIEKREKSRVHWAQDFYRNERPEQESADAGKEGAK